VTDGPAAIGPDGTVRLRCYLSLADLLWFSAGCQGRAGCGHVAPISVRAAIRIMGSGKVTAGQLEQHLRCSQCGNRQVGLVVRPDVRSPKVRDVRPLLPYGLACLSVSWDNTGYDDETRLERREDLFVN
jgi:hypothetical protein